MSKQLCCVTPEGQGALATLLQHLRQSPLRCLPVSDRAHSAPLQRTLTELAEHPPNSRLTAITSGKSHYH